MRISKEKKEWLLNELTDDSIRMRRLRVLYSGNVVHDSRQLCYPIVDYGLHYSRGFEKEKTEMKQILLKAHPTNCAQIKIDLLDVIKRIREKLQKVKKID